VKVKIIGLGSPLRTDDGLGTAAIERLAERGNLPPEAELIDGGLCGLSLLDLIEGADAVILVDAVQSDEPPGTIIRTSADQILRMDTPPGSVHEFRVAETLHLADSLGTPLPPITLVGMVPQDISPGQSLSAAVDANFSSLLDSILVEMQWALTGTSETT